MNSPLFQRLLNGWPFVVLGTLVLVFALMITFSRKAPVIVSMEPSMAAPGQTVTVTGDYFGRTAREGTLNLAGEIPPPSLIQTWNDQKIVFVVPEDASSGLVTVSNSQGTSLGVLFTNTESIPTVLRAASVSGEPLVFAVVPGQPSSGQLVTLTGRGFGAGDEKGRLRFEVGPGVVLELASSESVKWTDRSVVFRWPAGAGVATKLSLVTPRGRSEPLSIDGSTPLSLGDPRTVVVGFRAKVAVPGSTSANVWGPIPETSAGTVWSVVSSDTPPLVTDGFLAFPWSQLVPGDHQLSYRLSLTTYAWKWNGWPAGAPPVQAAPTSDDRPGLWWRSSAAALKVLTASWGLAVSDPWLRIQKIQAGLSAAFRFVLTPRTGTGLSSSPETLLSSGRLDSIDASSLAAFMAAQSGIPSRLVSGLWWAPDGRLSPRVWVEVWIAGAGWIPWDVVDGNPGNLDNRHYAFQSSTGQPKRFIARSRLFGAPGPLGLGLPSGEAAGSQELPRVQWELARLDK